MVQQGQFRAQLAGQGILSQYDGLNLLGRFATGINEDVELQFEAGAGQMDFTGGAFVKYVPFPDTDSQPAIGVRAGLSYSRDNQMSVTKLMAQPFISKSFVSTQAGTFTPFLALPLAITFVKSDTTVPIHGVIGTEWRPPQLKKVKFVGEYGGNMIKAFNYVAFAVAVDFDGESIIFE